MKKLVLLSLVCATSVMAGSGVGYKNPMLKGPAVTSYPVYVQTKVKTSIFWGTKKSAACLEAKKDFSKKSLEACGFGDENISTKKGTSFMYEGDRLLANPYVVAINSNGEAMCQVSEPFGVAIRTGGKTKGYFFSEGNELICDYANPKAASSDLEYKTAAEAHTIQENGAAANARR